MNTPLTRLRELRDAARPGDPAADLISALPMAAPISSNAKARIWTKLHAPPKRRVSVPLSLRLAAAAILLMATAAFAGNRMHLFGALSSTFSGSSTESGAAAGAAPAVAAPRKLPLPGIAQPEARENAEAIPSAEPGSEVKPEPARVSSMGAATARASAVAAPPAAASVSAQPSEAASPALPVVAEPARSMDEAELVLDGLRALRKEGDPARAQALFSQYLAKHPNGALADDALGYQMEAADRAGSPDTLRLARAYLSSHPSGRYARLAQRLRDKSVE